MLAQLLGYVQLILLIALFSLMGQALLYVLAGPHRERNLFYQMLRTIPLPFVKLFRFLTPRFIQDRFVPFAAFCGLSATFLWLAIMIPRL